MSSAISPSHFHSLSKISENYLAGQRSVFLCVIAEIGALCSDNVYEHVEFFIAFLGQLMKLHANEKYRRLIESHLEHIVYADLTDHFISYPIQIQIEIMTIIERTPILRFPLIRHQSESDQSKVDLFLQDAGRTRGLFDTSADDLHSRLARYFHSASSRSLYRRLVFRLDEHRSSQQSIFRALTFGCLFLPLTCHSGFLTELYDLLAVEPRLLSLANMKTFFHVLWPTGINQFYSVPRVYLCQLVIVRLLTVEKYFAQILHICFVIYMRIAQIRINLNDIIEPLYETPGFHQYLDQQEQEFNL
jgi:hypothetical protein